MNVSPCYKMTELGEIPEDWQVLPLREIVGSKKETVDPSRYPDETFELYSIPAYYERRAPELKRGKDIQSLKLLVSNDTVLFGKINPRVTKIWFVFSKSPFRKVASTEFIPLTSNSRSLARYVYHLAWSSYLLRPSRSLTLGTTPSRKRVDAEAYLDLLVPVPSLREQERIASVLSTLDDAIQKTDDIISKTQQLKKGLMRQLLTKGIGHTKFKQTEIGEIPEEWELERLGNCLLSDPQNGIYKDQSFYDRGTNIVRIDDFYDGSFIRLSGFERLELSDSEIATYMLRPRDILVNRVNSLPFLGKVAIVPELTEPTAFESNMMKITTRPDRLLPEYTIAWLCAEHAKAHFLSRAKRAVAQASINQGDLCSLLVPVPSIAEQTEIIRVLQSAQEKLTREAEEKEQLTRLKKGLMQVLLTGKVRVKVS